MPAHNHANGDYKYILKKDCRLTTSGVDDGPCGEPNVVVVGELLSQGGNQPFNLLPPFLVVKICQKKSDGNELTSIKDFDSKS